MANINLDNYNDAQLLPAQWASLQAPAPVQTMSTPYAPTVAPTQVMSSPTPPLAMQPTVWGDPTPAAAQLTGGVAPTFTMTYPSMSGNTPPQVSPVPQYSLPSLDGSSYVAQATGNPGAAPMVPQAQATGGAYQSAGAPGGLGSAQAAQSVMGNLNGILDSNNPFMANAAQRGIEMAQNRGLRNSSIAAGASTRSAIEASMPILSQIQNLQGLREGQAFQGTQADLDRAQNVDMLNRQQTFNAGQSNADRELSMLQQRESLGFQGEQNQLERIQRVNDAMLDFEFRRSMQDNSVLQQDWLEQQSYTREFNGSLAAMPIQNAAQLSSMIAQYAIDNPEVYTPQVISGMQNFFTGSFTALLQQYFPSTYGSAPAAAPAGGG